MTTNSGPNASGSFPDRLLVIAREISGEDHLTNTARSIRADAPGKSGPETPDKL